jgi:hypothetical protein
MNVKTSVTLEAKALGGDGVEVPEALMAMTAIFRAMIDLTENLITSLGYEFLQLVVSATCCKVFSGPSPGKSAVTASGSAELLASMGLLKRISRRTV